MANKPKKDMQHLHITLPPHLHKWLNDHAKKTGISVSTLLRIWIAEKEKEL